MHSGTRRMARTTWEPVGGRATPCGRGRGNQFSARMHALRPAGAVLRSTLAALLAAGALAGGCARTHPGAPFPPPDVNRAELRVPPRRQDPYLGASECGSFARP